MKRKILIITPKMPFPKTGACEQDRGYGIEDFIRLGYEVRVIAKTTQQKVSLAAQESARLNISLVALPYVHATFFSEGILQIIKRLVSPWTWDGAAFEYYDSAIQEAVTRTLDGFKPDVVWFDYSYMWPLYHIAQQRNIPIITRSQNFEPSHFLQEDGKSLINLLKYIPKLISEIIVIRKSRLILAITPNEERIYKRRGAEVRTLPLRGLPHLLADRPQVSPKEVLDVFFFGSTYNVHHNRHALEFLLKEIIPEVQRRVPGKFNFHILGAKIPADLEVLCHGHVRYEGYVQDLSAFLKDMDIAVIPSLMGAGMQQKIFEPLVRGIPLVTSPRGIAGYSFHSPTDYRSANSAVEFADAIISLQDAKEREKISAHALSTSQNVFSRAAIDSILVESINTAISS